MRVRNVREKWGKMSLPIRFSIISILFHWAVLFPVTLAIDGHPPLPLLFVELPTVIIVYLFSFLLPVLFYSTTEIPEYFLYIIAIPAATISYGLFGYIVGYFYRRKRLKMKNIIAFLMIGIALSMFSSPAFAAGPWKGKIIDIETKEPLEGAVVLAVWERVYRTPAGPNSYFYDAKEVLTDKEGRFEIPSYSPINLLPLISYMRGPYFTFFQAWISESFQI